GLLESSQPSQSSQPAGWELDQLRRPANTGQIGRCHLRQRERLQSRAYDFVDLQPVGADRTACLDLAEARGLRAAFGECNRSFDRANDVRDRDRVRCLAEAIAAVNTALRD